MDLPTTKLLNELIEITNYNKQEAEKAFNLSEELLNKKLSDESWSILECYEHINRYGDFYIPEIDKRMANSKHPFSNVFKSNWLGRYFSGVLRFNENQKTMKTLKSMNPIYSDLQPNVLETFIDQQIEILNLLEKARKVNWDKTKTAISISKLIKLKLGDSFRVLIYHNERHVKQAEKIWK